MSVDLRVSDGPDITHLLGVSFNAVYLLMLKLLAAHFELFGNMAKSSSLTTKRVPYCCPALSE
jgi:hypothetical protein